MIKKGGAREWGDGPPLPEESEEEARGEKIGNAHKNTHDVKYLIGKRGGGT